MISSTEEFICVEDAEKRTTIAPMPIVLKNWNVHTETRNKATSR